MSFSSEVKNEISHLPIENDCCALAELSSLIRMSGSIKYSGDHSISIIFSTENAAIARRIFSILKKIYDVDVEVSVRKNKQLKKNNNYLVAINNTEMAIKILTDTGFIGTKDYNIFNPNYKIPKWIVEKKCCKRSYIRGAFLGGGSMNNPEKSYHLEFVNTDYQHARDLQKLINSFGSNSKTIKRKEFIIVYLKEAEKISDILNIIGAHQALLKFEEIRVLKDVRNNINRIVNCETANLEKTVEASMRQIEAIKIIKDKKGINYLPKQLRDVAEIRLLYPDATLKEIGEKLDPPIGKSGVNHRFKKIQEIADELKE
ncbi:MAG: DNA-binding protein WhiA [Tissierellales bacterium]|nr:DNA-binding protein WhiA [Tissierellales bacterium]